MCGIAYAHDFRGHPVNNLILDTFDAQRSRGTQGFGLYDGQEGHIVRARTEDQILKWLVRYESHLILFHHRYPTSTDNTRNTAHPFTTGDYFDKTQYLLVHNGHIHNSATLKPEHEKLGISYSSVLNKGTFNDSESLLWDVALTLEGKQPELKANGGMAFICLKLVKGKLEKMYFGRNTYPLKLFRARGGLLLSSEGEGEPIEPQTLYTWNYKLKRLTHKPFAVPTFTATTTTYPDSGYQYNNRSDYERKRWLEQDTWPTKTNQYNDAWEYGDEYEDEYEDEVDWEAYEKPDRTVVEGLYLAYLTEVGGHFEAAYNNLESDYSDLAADPVTKEDYDKVRLYEATLNMMETDSEWLGGKSRSSLVNQLTLPTGKKG